MPEETPESSKATKMSWLADVLEITQPLSEANPIWVRETIVTEGPPTSTPERHPYCESNIVLAGVGDSLVETESGRRTAGTAEFLGPGVPHWGHIMSYPTHSIVVYFLPWLLIELGPREEGMQLLRRFTAKQTLEQRLVRPSKEVFDNVTSNMREMLKEFHERPIGYGMRLRALLMDLLVGLSRWEAKNGRLPVGTELEEDWRPVLRTLQFIREHYEEPIYSAEITRAAGVSASRLKVLFHKVLGLSWVKFLQGYRITRAVALLGTPGYNVTEAGFAVGFESLSHFNNVFTSFMGASPRNFLLLQDKLSARQNSQTKSKPAPGSPKKQNSSGRSRP